MRRAVFALTAVILIILLAEPLGQVAVVEANAHFISSSSINIGSPMDFKDRIYHTSTINLSISASETGNSPGIRRMSYSLDGKPNVYLNFSQSDLWSRALGTGTLENLTDGYHTLTAYALTNFYSYEMSTSTTFLVNTTVGFPPFLVSPLNKTYSRNEVPLNYAANEQASSYIYSFYAANEQAISYYYSLDNSNYSSLSSNITLTGLSEGNHTVTVKATDSYGTLHSEQTTYFTVDTTMQTLTTNLAITLGILAIGSVLAVFTYRKRKAIK